MKNKIYRFKNAAYSDMWDKEAEIIASIRDGELDQSLLLYKCNDPTLVLPAGRKWQASEQVVTALEHAGWGVLARRSGGAPVPQTSGLINLSHFYLWPEHSTYSVKLAYEHLCQVLSLFFKRFGVESQAHATPYSFCDGDYNMNINGQKVVGTAQRVLSVRQGRKLVLAQACLIIDDDMLRLVEPVNLVNELHGYADDIKPEAHTCLAEHVTELPNTDTLYSALVQAFIDSKLYA